MRSLGMMAMVSIIAPPTVSAFMPALVSLRWRHWRAAEASLAAR
jgi:hypothetical protein